MLIGELAKATQTTKDTIRHYDELGLLISHDRQAGSRIYKEFSDENIERLESIRMAKYMGFTLGEIAKQIEDYFSGGISQPEQIAMLKERMTDIDKKMKELQGVKQFLFNKIQLIEQSPNKPKQEDYLRLMRESQLGLPPKTD